MIMGILGREVKGAPLEENQGWLAAARVPLEMGSGPSLELVEGWMCSKGADPEL